MGNADFAPGHKEHRFHLQEGTTHAAALDRLRKSGGYLAVFSGEGGPLLCPSWPSAGTWNTSTHTNYQKFLDAASRPQCWKRAPVRFPVAFSWG